MMKLSYMWDGHPTTLVVLSRYCLFHSLCMPEVAYQCCDNLGKYVSRRYSQQITLLMPTLMSGPVGNAKCLSLVNQKMSQLWQALQQMLKQGGCSSNCNISIKESGLGRKGQKRQDSAPSGQ